MQEKIIVIGGGLAGIEAAHYLANRGCMVKLYEMRPNPKAYAHHTDLLGELVCSNSLKGKKIDNAAGLLKEEMNLLNSLVIEAAKQSEVPAGNALAVDRQLFSQYIDERIRNHPLIEVIHQEVVEIPNSPTIIASGPLTSEGLFKNIEKMLGSSHLYFYDAAAPLVTKDSLDFNIVYRKSRYDKGGDDYLNCPFTLSEFHNFYNELINAETVKLKEFEKEIYFEGCMPIEVMAKRGSETLRFGPMKPVGLLKPDGTRPHAVVQLRQDDLQGNLYNIVGFQTNLNFKEQKRIFSLIPGLEKVNIVRYGVMHRNTYICAPRCLRSTMQSVVSPMTFFAGQLSGVEGYIESAASGIVAGINALRFLRKQELSSPPPTTMLGSLLNYISSANSTNFQPMNANFGIIPIVNRSKLETSEKALRDMERWIQEQKIFL